MIARCWWRANRPIIEIDREQADRDDQELPAKGYRVAVGTTLVPRRRVLCYGGNLLGDHVSHSPAFLVTDERRR